MIPGITASQPGTEGAGADPYFSSVVLLLHGDSATDMSPIGNVATVSGGASSNSSDFPNSAVAGNAIRIPAGATSTFGYSAPATTFNKRSTFTLEFWYRVNAPAISYSDVLSPSDFSKKFELRNAGGGQLAVTQEWLGNIGGSRNTAALDSNWHYVQISSDGVANISSYFVDGVRVATTTTYQDLAAKDFFIALPAGLSSPQDFSIMELRWTQGVCRYDPNELTAIVQSTPWPDA